MVEMYMPTDGSYLAFPGVFGTWAQGPGEPPNPCRKYHISADLDSAAGVAAAALPVLRDLRVYHKLVRSRSLLAALQAGNQAGKFITVYTPVSLPLNTFVERVGAALAAVPGLRPSPRIPRSRPYRHVFAERPLDEGMFIYGGFEADPQD
jgi:hypothetical protein